MVNHENINNNHNMKESHLYVFDIDGTLFNSDAKIYVRNNGVLINSLSSSDFNSHDHNPNHYYDFSEFRSADKFKEANPIEPVISLLNDVHNKTKTTGKGKIIINTARRDVDDREKFLEKFRDHGIDIDNIHIHRAGNLLITNPKMSPGEAKNYFVREYLNTGEYSHATLYDDHTHNLDEFLNLVNEFPKIIFTTFHVKPDWSMTIYN